MTFLGRFRNSNTQRNPRQLKRRTLTFALARFIGLIPFSFVIENSIPCINPSTKWLLYSVGINTGLALLSIQISLEIMVDFLANPIGKFAIIYGVYNTWILHSLCIIYQKRFLTGLQKLYSLPITKGYEKPLLKSGGVVYCGLSVVLYGITIRNWLTGELFASYSVPVFIGLFTSFAVNTGFVAFVFDTICTLCESLKSLEEQIDMVKAYNMHEVQFIGCSDTLHLLNAADGLKRKYMEIFQVSSALEGCFSIHFVLLVLSGFFETTIISYNTFLDYDGFDFLTGICAYAKNVLMLFTLFTAGQRSISENDSVAMSASEALVKSYLPASVREELQDLSLQMLHLRLRFTAHGFFPMDYPNLLMVIGAVTTYLIILLQTNNPSKESTANNDAVSSAATAAASAAANAIFNEIISSSLTCG